MRFARMAGPVASGLGHPARSDAVLAEVGSLAHAPQTPFIAFHALLVLAAANDPAAIRAIEVPDATDAQATTLSSSARV